MRLNLIFFADTIAAVALSFGLASGSLAAEKSFAEIEAAAKKEGALVIYTSIPDSEMNQAVPLFQAHYPEIKVQFIRLPSAQLFSRFMGENDAGATQGDFLASGSSALYQQRPELFIPLGAEIVPNLAQTPIAKAANPNYTLFQVDPHVVTYNTDLVKPEDLKTHLATWEALADPYWAGKMALNDPRNSSNQMSFMIMLKNTYGADWFTRFNANKPDMVGTASAGAQQVAAGAYQILFPTIPSQSAGIRAQGAPVALYLPGGMAHAPAQGMAVPLAAPHPNAGLLFLNWKLSHEGQALTCRLGAVPVYHVDDPDCHATLPEQFILGLDVIDAATQKQIFDLLGLRP